MPLVGMFADTLCELEFTAIAERMISPAFTITMKYLRGHPRDAGVHSTLLKKSPFRERQAVVVADDEVIEHADIHQRECIAQAARDELVRLAGFGHS